MKPGVNLLVIEDNPADFDLIQEYVSEINEFDSNLVCVSTLSEGLKYLVENNVHAVLVDMSLPDSRGLDTVREVVRSLKSATAIVLTSLDDKDVALKSLESGAQDYLLKDRLDPEILSRVIRFSLQRSKWNAKMVEVQSQLYQAQKMEMIGRLAGGIAHDFNNQLGVVTLLCSLINGQLESDHPAQKYISKIQLATERSASLTKRLLAFSAVHPIESKVTGLNEIVLESEELFGKLLGSKISFQTSLAEEVYIQVDPGMLEQVLMNLAINARDAMPKGGTLKFTTEIKNKFEDLKSPHVILSVSDTGTGMSEETLAKIFDPFYTTKEIGKGTGLGLSMALGTVKQSGGKISVQSKLGVGTTFRIMFPIVEISDELSHSAKGSEFRPVEKVHDLQNILIVEDEVLLREATQQILQQQNYHAVVANDAEEALSIIKSSSTHFHLLIADVNLPSINGVELAKEVRLVNPEIKILFTSGYMSSLLEGIKDMERVSFLAKPANSTQILESVRELLLN